MPSFTVNGVTVNTSTGTVSVPAPSSTFTFSWSGVSEDQESNVYIELRFSNYEDLTISEGTDSSIYFYANQWYYNMSVSNGYVSRLIKSSGSASVTCSAGLVGGTLTIHYYSYNTGHQYCYATFEEAYPTITAQPVITSMSPTSGSSTTITWSAATVSNLGSAMIYYQYSVGPSSTYTDDYYIATTTDRTAVVTEEDILSKCGSNFEGTCYIFVRAFWVDGSANGGWYSPSGRAFTYVSHNFVRYRIGNQWVDCVPYVRSGSAWVECVPYVRSGNGWIECSV